MKTFGGEREREREQALVQAFSTYMNTLNLKMFHNHSGIYRFVRKFHKIYGEMKAKWAL